MKFIFKFLFFASLLFANISFAGTDPLYLNVPTPKNTEQQQTLELVKTYYESLNNKDMDKLYSILDQNVVHDINQGKTEQGLDKFKAFMTKVNNSFDEQIRDLVIMISDDGKYAAAEWIDHGQYVKDYRGLSVPAHNQYYTLPGGHFFRINNGKIAQVTTYYNENDFMNQIKH